MAVMPTSIKFTPEQRQWLQAEAKIAHNGKVGTLIKSIIDRKRNSVQRAKRVAK